MRASSCLIEVSVVLLTAGGSARIGRISPKRWEKPDLGPCGLSRVSCLILRPRLISEVAAPGNHPMECATGLPAVVIGNLVPVRISSMPSQ
jgi:hypothetical protein